jgi:hypothetical protein
VGEGSDAARARVEVVGSRCEEEALRRVRYIQGVFQHYMECYVGSRALRITQVAKNVSFSSGTQPSAEQARVFFGRKRRAQS